MLSVEYCFFHIEKCMGSSLRIMLYNFFKNIYTEDEIYYPEKYKVTQNLIKKEDYIFFEKEYIHNIKVLLCHCSFNHRNITDKFSTTCYSITCIANPIDRIISHFYYFDKDKYNRNLYELDESEITDYLVKRNRGGLITYRLSGSTNDILIAKDNLDKIDCILLLESIEEDIVILNAILNKRTTTNNNINIIKKNVNIDNYKDNKTKDVDILLKYIHLIKDMEIYGIIKDMTIDERIKPFVYS